MLGPWLEFGWPDKTKLGIGISMTGRAFLTRAGLILAVVLIAGCSRLSVSLPAAEKAVEEMSAEEIYQAGEYALERGRNPAAAEYFGEIERLYPYSDWASRGLVMQAYAYHLEKDFIGSRASAERYLAFYPTLDDAAYAQYLLALSYYDQIFDVGRDQGMTVKALQSLRAVFENYPNSEYADPAKERFDLAFEHLASKELEVGRFYLKDGHYTSAINRFRVVVEDFPTTRYTPEALYRLVEAYTALGLTGEAQAALAVLQSRFSDSEWYADALVLLGEEGAESTQLSGAGWLSNIYRKAVSGDWL